MPGKQQNIPYYAVFFKVSEFPSYTEHWLCFNDFIMTYIFRSYINASQCFILSLFSSTRVIFKRTAVTFQDCTTCVKNSYKFFLQWMKVYLAFIFIRYCVFYALHEIEHEQQKKVLSIFRRIFAIWFYSFSIKCSVTNVLSLWKVIFQ